MAISEFLLYVKLSALNELLTMNICHKVNEIK